MAQFLECAGALYATAIEEYLSRAGISTAPRNAPMHDGDSLSRHLGYRRLTTEPFEAQIRDLLPRE